VGQHQIGDAVVTPIQILRAQQLDPGNWGGWGESIGQLVTALGGAVVVRELIKQVFARAKDGDENARLARADLRVQMADLSERMNTLQKRLDEREEAYRQLFAVNADLRAENVALRGRYHRLLNWSQEIVGTLDLYAERLNIPEHERLRIPRWIDETVPGPTEDQSGQRRRATDRPESKP
jgi:hypothetical protein